LIQPSPQNLNPNSPSATLHYGQGQGHGRSPQLRIINHSHKDIRHDINNDDVINDETMNNDVMHNDVLNAETLNDTDGNEIQLKKRTLMQHPKHQRQKLKMLGTKNSLSELYSSAHS
jgi:hypothetical protein